MYTSVISGARQDCFNVGNNDCAWHQLTTNSFAKVVNMGHGSICRIKKNLICEGKIKSTYAEMHMADDRNEERWNEHCKGLVVGTLRLT